MRPNDGRARVFAHEVVAGDGLQVETKWTSTADRVALIDGSSRTGVRNSMLHGRMPVILAENNGAKWLGEVSNSSGELKTLLAPRPNEALKIWPVNRQRIGNVRNKGAEVTLPEATQLSAPL